jgi:hypothetical protein
MLLKLFPLASFLNVTVVIQNMLHRFPHVIVMIVRRRAVLSESFVFIPHNDCGYALRINFLEYLPFVLLLLTWLWWRKKTMDACVPIQR